VALDESALEEAAERLDSVMGGGSDGVAAD
jgi:hypothetical protein